ncbi:transposase [Streptomyces sp. NPDC088757]|uniref:transposase n=1 Tax=Streptomyces sp. NPDC088757 TaxID=3365889 RepID=UPI0037FB1222
MVPDGPWRTAAPPIPPFRPGQQGGGTAPVADRRAFTAVVHVLTGGCARRYPPPPFGASPAPAHRRSTTWTEAGPWRRPHRAVLDELGAGGELDGTSAIVDAASVRAKRGAHRPDRTRSIAARRAASRTCCPKPRASRRRRGLRRERARQPALQAATAGPPPPYGPGAGHGDGDRSRSALTRLTSPPNTSPGSAHGGSSRASRARGSSPASGSADTAGRSRGRSPGPSATAASPSYAYAKSVHSILT